MKLTDINKDTIKNISNKELISLHRRSHQLYIQAKNRDTLKLLSFLTDVHLLIVNEMEKRKLIHKSPLSLKVNFVEKYIFNLWS